MSICNCAETKMLTELLERKNNTLDGFEKANKSLASEIERLKKENEQLREAYKNKPIGTRKAMEETIRHLFSWLEDKININFTKDSREDVIRELAEDSDFFDDMLECLENHIDSFGENYGIVIEE